MGKTRQKMVPEVKTEQMVPTATIAKMVPQESGLSIDDVAAQIFVKQYMDSASKTPEYMADQAYKAAEAFIAFKQSRGI